MIRTSGNLIDIQTGEWLGHLSGLGAGIDSFYEYMLKSYILFGDPTDLEMYTDSFARIITYMRRGRTSCAEMEGEPPIYVNVDARDGSTVNTWIDSLQVRKLLKIGPELVEICNMSSNMVHS